jgi:hypothetical protein
VKCIRCGHDSKKKDRPNKTCPGCHGRFAFEPTEGDIMTDAAFQNAITAVSSDGRIKWGVEHLYYEINRRRRHKPPYGAIVVMGVIALGASLFLRWHQLVTLGILLFFAYVVVQAWHRTRTHITVNVELATFNSLWTKWLAAHGTPPGVILRKEQPKSLPRPVEPDLQDYSFDRAVICDRARTVDLLLANNFHFENNCAVLSAEGYPAGPFETVRAMLKRNPRLRVLALHDATPAGCQLATRLAGDPAWFKEQVPVIDVGLRPRHAPPFKGLLIPARGDFVPVGDGISPSEAAWLSSYALEVAAIRPEQVLKRLFKAMNREDDSGSSSSSGDGGGYYYGTTGSGEAGSPAAAGLSSPGGRGWVIEDSVSFGVEAGDSDGGADAFG